MGFITELFSRFHEGRIYKSASQLNDVELANLRAFRASISDSDGGIRNPEFFTFPTQVERANLTALKNSLDPNNDAYDARFLDDMTPNQDPLRLKEAIPSFIPFERRTRARLLSDAYHAADLANRDFTLGHRTEVSSPIPRVTKESRLSRNRAERKKMERYAQTVKDRIRSAGINHKEDEDLYEYHLKSTEGHGEYMKIDTDSTEKLDIYYVKAGELVDTVLAAHISGSGFGFIITDFKQDKTGKPVKNSRAEYNLMTAFATNETLDELDAIIGNLQARVEEFLPNLILSAKKTPTIKRKVK